MGVRVPAVCCGPSTSALPLRRPADWQRFLHPDQKILTARGKPTACSMPICRQSLGAGGIVAAD
jgi:hypothetical protein